MAVTTQREERSAGAPDGQEKGRGGPQPSARVLKRIHGILCGGGIPMKHVCVWLLVVGVSLVTCAPARAQVETGPSLEADITTLMEVTGSAKAADQIMGIVLAQLTQNARGLAPSMPQRAVDIASEVMQAKMSAAMHSPDGLMAKMVPVYAAHFSHDEVRQLLAFYETPVGKKIIEVMPLVIRDAMVVGQAWAAAMVPELQAELQRRFRAEGLIK